MHWAHPLLVDDRQFDDVWSRPRDDALLFVCGSGFDPRALAAVERLRAATARRIDGWMIELPEDATDLAVRPLAQANRTRITELVDDSGGELQLQALPDYHDTRSLGRLISRQFQESGVLDRYDEV